jgi:outer membrane receptor protein involved in Fe transport
MARPPSYSNLRNWRRGWQASHEGRFGYSSDRLRGSAGWNYFYEDGIQNVPFSSEEGTFLQCFGPATVRIPGIPCVNAAGVPTAADFTRLATGGLVTQLPYTSVFENQGRNRTVSVFADATFIPVPALELTAGVRYLRERRRSGFFARVPRLQINPAALSLIPTQIDTAGQTFEATRTFDAWLPRFNALLRLNDRVNVLAPCPRGAARRLCR